jgi:hypothetical protein
MALMEVDFYSRVLGLQSQAYAIIPQSESGIGIGGQKGGGLTRCFGCSTGQATIIPSGCAVPLSSVTCLPWV